MRRLRIPCAIAFTVVATASGASMLGSACGGGQSPPDGQLADGLIPTDGLCSVFCIPDDQSDAGMCPNPAPCADEMGNCPAGCRPVG
jgi:hypothetical protein